MQIIIFDVDHGFCAFVKTPTGQTILIDCGCKIFFSPILYLAHSGIIGETSGGEYSFTQFILTHPHGDHIQDIDMLDVYRPRIMYAQRGYDWEKVAEVNSASGKRDVSSLRGMLESYTGPVPAVDYGCNISTYSLSPTEAERVNSAKMVNNSSIQVVISYGGFKIAFCGDIESDGLDKILENEAFKRDLWGVNVFVAPHHGHSSGYNKNIFSAIGKPDIVIVSAKPGDQHIDSAYSANSNVGGMFSGNGVPRYMLSTRKDGSMVIHVEETGAYRVVLTEFDDNIVRK